MNTYDRYGEVELYDPEDQGEKGEKEFPAIPGEVITYDQIGLLLDQAVARDQRTIGEADVHAWYTDLNLGAIRYGFKYKDACDALSYYYAVVYPSQDKADRFRATTSTIIELARKVREKRHSSVNFVYEPVPGETVLEYQTRLRKQLAAIGDGHIPPAPPALDQAGRAQLKPLLEGVTANLLLPKDIADQAARDLARMPPELAKVLAPRRHPARSVRCPRCGASQNKPCLNERGQDGLLGGGRRVHPSRVEAFATAATTCPTCEQPPGTACTEAVGAGRAYAYRIHPLRVEDATADYEQAAG